MILFVTGESTVIWKQANRIISAGEVIIRKDRRLSLHNRFNLRIDVLQEDDAGEYICEVETYGSPISQISNLEILGECRGMHVLGTMTVVVSCWR